MASKKTVKEVTFIARVELKCDHRKVVYLVRSSNGVDQYETTMFDGKAVGCSCKSRKPCYHMKGAEAREAARQASVVAPAQVEKAEKVAQVETTEKDINGQKFSVVRSGKCVLFTAADKPVRKQYDRIKEQREQRENKREILAEARTIRERRECAPLNGNRGFSLMR
jgi:hypothetical protein